MSDTIVKGDIVQLDPEKTSNPAFAGQLLIVTEPKLWGVVGYVALERGLAFYRAESGTFARTGGKAVWMSE